MFDSFHICWLYILYTYYPEFLIEILTHFVIIEYLGDLHATFNGGVYLPLFQKRLEWTEKTG